MADAGLDPGGCWLLTLMLIHLSRDLPRGCSLTQWLQNWVAYGMSDAEGLPVTGKAPVTPVASPPAATEVEAGRKVQLASVINPLSRSELPRLPTGL